MVQQRRLFDSPTLVGRDREMDQLREALSSMLAGHGNLVLVSGEAGIGKTTLVRWLVAAAREDEALVLTGGCYDLTITPPYGPWSEVIRGYQPTDEQQPIPAWFSDPEALGKVGSQAALFEETQRFFGQIAAEQPLVIVLEDLHWSDPASLDLLRHLARQFQRLRILLIATYRDDEITRRHPLFQLLPLLARESEVQRLDLQRLNPEASRALVANGGLTELDAVRLAGYLETRADGNPLFITELLRTLELEGILRLDSTGATLGNLDNLPLSPFLQQVIEQRLTFLDKETREALEIAAVIGHEIPFDIWETVGSLNQPALDRIVEQALTSHILVETPERQTLQFVHVLVREVLYEGIIPTRRRIIHRQIGEVLERQSRSDPDTVAHHFRQASDERAIDWLIRAGDRAERSYAWPTAVERFEEALRLLASADDRTGEHGWLLYRVGKLLRFSDTARGIAYLEEAGRAAAAVGDQALAAYAVFDRGRLRCIALDIRRGLAEMATGIESLQTLPAGSHDYVVENVISWVADALPSTEPAQGAFPDPRIALTDVLTRVGTYALWLSWTGYYQDALRIAEPYVVQAAEIPAAANGYGDACTALGTSYAALGRPANARQMFARARKTYQSVDHHILDGTAAMLDLRDVLLVYTPEQIAERRKVGSEAEAAWLRGASGGVGGPSRAQLPLLLLEGKWDEARQISLTMPDHFRARNRDNVGGNLGVLARNQGENDLAWSWVNEAFPEGPLTTPGDVVFAGYATVLLRLAVMLSLDASDLPMASAWHDAYDRWLEWSGSVAGRAESRLLLARFHQISGDLGQAREHAEAALDYASEPRQPLVLVAVHRILGRLATQEKRIVEAEKHLHESLTLAKTCHAPYEIALTQFALAELHLSVGSAPEIQDLLREVKTTCLSLGAHPLLRHVDAMLTAITAQRDAATGHSSGLSARELEILQRVADGMTNAEIAEALFISPRTVAQHLRSVYNKLGVNSRAAAVARWAEVASD